MNDESLWDILDEDNEDFTRIEYEKHDGRTHCFFKTKAPAVTMLEILTKMKPYLEDMGYEVAGF